MINLGKACIIAALSSYQFDRVVGIELIPSLHDVALSTYNQLQQLVYCSSSSSSSTSSSSNRNSSTDVYHHHRNVMHQTDINNNSNIDINNNRSSSSSSSRSSSSSSSSSRNGRKCGKKDNDDDWLKSKDFNSFHDNAMNLLHRMIDEEMKQKPIHEEEISANNYHHRHHHHHERMITSPCDGDDDLDYKDGIQDSIHDDEYDHHPNKIDTVVVFYPSISIDKFANELCKIIGHKVFKLNNKHFKSFLRYLKSYISIYKVDDSNKMVTLLLTDKTNNYSDNAYADDGENDVNDDADKTNSVITKNDDNCRWHFNITDQDRYLFQPQPDLVFINSDIFAVKWWLDATVVYVASLLFSDAMMMMLSEQVLCMEHDTWFITLKPLVLPSSSSPMMTESTKVSTIASSASIPSELSPSSSSSSNHSIRIQLHSESFYKMSWQMAKVYIYHIL
jgi:hypothetical protein